jgi:hypothetical protein
MPLPLELGQVSDPHTRRALEQLSLARPAEVPVVKTLPAGAHSGQIVFLSTDFGLYVFHAGSWRKT